MIRLGLIGCGEHSEGGHAIPLSKYAAAHPGEVELCAACDIKLERAEHFCRNYGFKNAYVEIEEMFAKAQLDACIAVVPIEKISQVAIGLLQMGMPCLIEKPLGASLAEVKALRQAARATATPHMVSVNRRFMPYLNRAMEWAHKTGDLRYVRCTMSRHARTEPEFLWATAVHAVDSMRHIAGNVVDANIHALSRPQGGADWYAIDLRFASGVRGRIDVMPTAGILEETYEMMGEGFRVIVTCPFGPIRGWRAFRENRIVVEEEASADTPEDVINGCYEENATFIRALLRKQPLRPSIEDVFPSVELCWEMSEKAKQNTLIPIQ